VRYSRLGSKVIRQVVLERFNSKFRLPLSYDDTMITEPAGLEWGQIQYSLHAFIDLRRRIDGITSRRAGRNSGHRRF
jgi:hypothetical protein